MSPNAAAAIRRSPNGETSRRKAKRAPDGPSAQTQRYIKGFSVMEELQAVGIQRYEGD